MPSPYAVRSPEDRYQSPLRDSVQHLAFANCDAELVGLGYAIVGVSSQSLDVQRRAIADTGVRHTLLSDPDLVLAQALGLPTFRLDQAEWYRRLVVVTGGSHRGGVLSRHEHAGRRVKGHSVDSRDRESRLPDTALASGPTGRATGAVVVTEEPRGDLPSKSLEARRDGGPRVQPTSAVGGFSRFHPAAGAVRWDARRGARRMRAGGADEPAKQWRAG